MGYDRMYDIYSRIMQEISPSRLISNSLVVTCIDILERFRFTLRKGDSIS